MLRPLLLAGGFALSLTLTCAAPAYAEPPGRAARVVETWGNTWIFDPEDREWTALTRNQTLAEGDRIRTEARARIKLSLGSTSLWLGEETDLDISHLDDQQVDLRLDRGNLGLQFRATEIANEFRIQTREGLSFPEQEGLFRIAQLDRGTIASILNGRLRFDFKPDASGSVQRVWLRESEQVELWWATGPRTERTRLQDEPFTSWIAEQSRVDNPATGVTARYVSPEMTGAEDLDRHGRWEQSPEYGSVWIPTTVSANWAPFQDGRWSWSIQWGWTWVDAAPWGFAPFHYGRWVEWRGRWCWTPGAYFARPAYAPALASWFGKPATTSWRARDKRPPLPPNGHSLPHREVYKPTFSTHGVRGPNHPEPNRAPPEFRSRVEIPIEQPRARAPEAMRPEASEFRRREDRKTPPTSAVEQPRVAPPSHIPFSRERPSERTPMVNPPQIRPAPEVSQPQTPPSRADSRPPAGQPRADRRHLEQEVQQER